MRKGIKLAFRLAGFILLFLVLFVIVVPIMFKDEIIDVVRRSIDQRIEGAFYFDKAQVGILRTFPNLCVHLTSPVLTGSKHPDGDSLFVAESLDVVVDIKSLLKSGVPVKVVGIQADSPRVSLYSDKNGVTNYQLIAPDTSTTEENSTPLIIDIERYQLNQGSLRFIDDGSGLTILLTDFYHQGHLRYEDDIVNLETETEKGVLTLLSGSTTYINGVQIAGSNDVRLDLANSVYTLLENTLSLNSLNISGSGSITQTGPDILFDLKFSGERSAFKDLISLLPNLYTSDFDALRASGNIALEADLQGTLSETSVPVYHLSLQVDNGAFQYPDKPFGFGNVALRGALHNTTLGWQPEEILLSKLHFELNRQPFDAQVRVQHPAGKPRASGMIKGQLKLADLISAYPLPQINTLTGLVDVDVTFDIDGSLPAGSQKVTGSLMMRDLALQSGEEDISVQHANIDFTPEMIRAATQTTQWNGSAVHADIKAGDYLNWILHDQPMLVTGNVSMEKLDVNRYLGASDAHSDADSTLTPGTGLGQIRFDGTVAIDSFIYESYVVEHGNAVLKGTLESLEVVMIEGQINGTRFTGNGNFRHIDQYIDGTAPLSGTLDCRLDKVNVDRWLEEEGSSTSTASDAQTVYVPLPEQMTLDVAFRADRLVYDKIEIENPRGMLHLENQVLEIHDFNGRGIGGDIAFSGLYNTQDIEHPEFNMRYTLKSLRFDDAFRQIESFQILAPIVKFIQGAFNSDLVFAGRLGKNYMPDFNTLTASGFLETLSGSIQQADIMNKVSQFLNLKKPLQWDLANTRNWFEVRDGYLTLQELTKSVDGIDVSIGGRHKIQGDMDYLIKLNIPADRLTQNPAGALAKVGFEQLQSKAAAYGVNLKTIENFIVHLAMRGKLNDPKFEILLFDASGKSLKEVASAQLEEMKKQARDTISGLAQEKINVVRDSVRNVIDAAVDSARRAAEEKLKATGKELLTESTAKLDSTIRDSITNSVLNKLGEKGLENLGQKETGKIKDALEKWDPFKKKKKDQ